MWYYSDNGRQEGPLDDAGLDRLIVQGVVTGDTFVWREGLGEWTPLSRAGRATAPSPSVGATSVSTCSLCHKPVGEENLIDLLGHRVCAACKPLAMQSLQEGAPLLGSGNAWSDKKKVVTHDKMTLPPRCFKCNQPSDGRPLTRKLYWHHPLIYLLLFARVIPYLIVALIVRKRATVELHFCAHHKQRRKNFILGGWIGALGGLALVVGGATLRETPVSVIGLAIFVLALVAGLFGASVARTARIKDKTVWITGAGREFLGSLPQWPG